LLRRSVDDNPELSAGVKVTIVAAAPTACTVCGCELTSEEEEQLLRAALEPEPEPEPGPGAELEPENEAPPPTLTGNMEEASAPAGDAHLPEAVTPWSDLFPTTRAHTYRSVAHGAIWSSAQRSTGTRIGKLTPGEEIVALSAQMVDGVLRVEIDRGWVSEIANNGKSLLEPISTRAHSLGMDATVPEPEPEPHSHSQLELEPKPEVELEPELELELEPEPEPESELRQLRAWAIRERQGRVDAQEQMAWLAWERQYRERTQEHIHELDAKVEALSAKLAFEHKENEWLRSLLLEKDREAAQQDREAALQREVWQREKQAHDKLAVTAGKQAAAVAEATGTNFLRQAQSAADRAQLAAAKRDSKERAEREVAAAEKREREKAAAALDAMRTFYHGTSLEAALAIQAGAFALIYRAPMLVRILDLVCTSPRRSRRP
jgi:hypothetical protein